VGAGTVFEGGGGGSLAGVAERVDNGGSTAGSGDERSTGGAGGSASCAAFGAEAVDEATLSTGSTAGGG
jgi:hypothetical protein